MEISTKEELNQFLNDFEGRLANMQETIDKMQPVEDEEGAEGNEELEDNGNDDLENSGEQEEPTEEELDEIEEMFND